MFLLFCQVLEKQPFFLFSVHIFYSVKVKQWRRLELRLVLGIIGAHSWVHRIPKRHYFKGQKFKVLFFFSELVCGSIIIALPSLFWVDKFHFVFSMGGQNELISTEPNTFLNSCVMNMFSALSFFVSMRFLVVRLRFGSVCRFTMINANAYKTMFSF